jgi:hypothetical protein
MYVPQRLANCATAGLAMVSPQPSGMASIASMASMAKVRKYRGDGDVADMDSVTMAKKRQSQNMAKN